MNFLSIRTQNSGPQKLLIISPDPFISQSSPDNSPQPRIEFSYCEILGPDICSLICESHILKRKLVKIQDSQFWSITCFVLRCYTERRLYLLVGSGSCWKIEGIFMSSHVGWPAFSLAFIFQLLLLLTIAHENNWTKVYMKSHLLFSTRLLSKVS